MYGFYILMLVFIVYLGKIKCDCSIHCDNFDCPCECYHNEVRCSNKSITEIFQYPVHMNIHVLDLDNNFISEVRPEGFGQKSLKNILGLRLSSNRIKRVQSKAFESLHHLEHLFLNHNYIVDLPEDAFVGLKNLRRLYLNDNKITILQDEIFEPLKPNLRLLYLHGNKIEHISPNLFKNFQHLTTLDISRNKITKMDGRFFLKMPSLEHVFLRNNPWSCDTGTVCSTIGAFRKTRQRREPSTIINRRLHHKSKRPFTVYGGMPCASPIQYMGEMAESLLKNLKCHEVNLTQYFSNVIVYGRQTTNKTENNGHQRKSSEILIFSTILLFMLICLS